ncbi:MAG: hypothetical protein KDJ75_01630 [Alphaproteobacteria bacterium]|nr:hypothetical protein [Alphaproteobacteria bacterium]
MTTSTVFSAAATDNNANNSADLKQQIFETQQAAICGDQNLRDAATTLLDIAARDPGNVTGTQGLALQALKTTMISAPHDYYQIYTLHIFALQLAGDDPEHQQIINEHFAPKKEELALDTI